MSFLDNLENNLKALESREEKDPAAIKEAQARREAERAAALSVAPLAAALKSGPFTEALILACRTRGHQQRTMVRITWLDTTLRLEATLRHAGMEKRLDLKPTPAGILATATTNGTPIFTDTFALEGADPQALAEKWLTPEAALPVVELPEED